MKFKAVSGIMLMLLLIGMLTLAFNLQAVRADSSITVIRHRITASELEELKQKVGVLEDGRDYNEIIEGHGTGAQPPTQEEWAKFSEEAYVVDEILWMNQVADPPSSVDHTSSPWFPPIGDQDGEGSCVAWAVGYYVKTFQEAKEHGWDLSGAVWEGGYKGYPTPEYQNRIFSPDFIYHLINRGEDMGSSPVDAVRLIGSVGACSWEKMPYDPGDHTSWPSEEAWREAPLYRGNGTGLEYMWLSPETGITSLKNWIASNNLALIDVDCYKFWGLTSNDVLTLDNYVNPVPNHANTIVGYDDNLEYMESGEIRHGAFKIANSWGLGHVYNPWEKIYDGCYWISYEAMKQRVRYCMFYYDRIGYEPELVASFRIDHPRRDDCIIAVGMGNTITPIQTKVFNEYVVGGDHPFCPNNTVLDITEFKDAVPTVINQSFFMGVFDRGPPPPHSGMYEWYCGGRRTWSYAWFRLGQTFDIPETGATLKFWSYYEIQNDWDYGYVEVHDLDTDEWCTLPGLMTVSTLPEPLDNPNCPSEFEPTAYYDAGRWNAFTGFSGVMYQEEMDLKPFADHTIELYFTYWTDSFIFESGWCIDDIEIPEVGFFDDVESGPGAWTYDGWYITTPGTINSFSIEYYYNYSAGTLCAKSTSPDVPVNTRPQGIVFVELILRRVYTLTIHSSPSAVTFTVGGVSKITPWSGIYSEGSSVSLVMPETHAVGEARYYWNQWSDGVTSRSRTVTTNTNITLAAHYTEPYYQLTVTSITGISPITGIAFTINDAPKTTPYTEWLLGGSYTLVMPQTYYGYMWSHWLEDGDTNRIKTITIPGTTWTAVYVPAPPPPPVGGKATPINIPANKPETPTLWIWLTILLPPIATTAVYVKLKKKKQ